MIRTYLYSYLELLTMDLTLRSILLDSLTNRTSQVFLSFPTRLGSCLCTDYTLQNLCTELKLVFPQCHVSLDYDPVNPSEAEIERFGRYDVAKRVKEIDFFSRAEAMKGRLVIAAQYHKLWEKRILRRRI